MLDIPVYSDEHQDHYKINEIGIINYKDADNIVLVGSEIDFDLGSYENARQIAEIILEITAPPKIKKPTVEEIVQME